MKNYILLALMLSSISFAFSVDTVTDFPVQMYGGSTYQAFYHVNGDAIYPVYAFVEAPEDFIVDCPYYEGWVCNTTKADFNITVRMPANITPAIYNISVQFSANYTVPDAPSSSGGSSNNGGGSFVGGSSYTPSNDETLTFSGQPLIVRRTASNRTVTLTITNNGSSLGPFTYRETIPYNVTSNDLTFSLQPDFFETGSLIAGWNFAGLDAGNSYTISYTFKSRNVGNLANFKSSFSETPKVVKPEAPKKNTTPVVLNDEKPAIWVPTKLTETMTNISDPSLPDGTVILKKDDITIPLIVLVVFAVGVGAAAIYISGEKKPPVEPKEPVTEAPTETKTPVEELKKEGEIVG